MIDGEKLPLDENNGDFFIPPQPMSWCDHQNGFMPRKRERGWSPRSP